MSLGRDVQLLTAAFAQQTSCHDRPLSCDVLLRDDMLVPLARGSTAVVQEEDDDVEEEVEVGVDCRWRRRVVEVAGDAGRMPETTRGSAAVVV